MSLTFLSIVEWLGAFTAIFGSYLMATVKIDLKASEATIFEKIQPRLGYSFWLISNFFCIYLFIQTKNDGLLMMNIGGVLINIIGFYLWSKNKSPSKYLTSTLALSSLFLLAISLYYLFNYFLELNNKDVEMFGSLLGLVAAFLLASKSKLSFLCWFIWSISNLTLLVLTFRSGMYGIAFLQGSFMLININGCIKWVSQIKRTKSFDIHTV